MTNTQNAQNAPDMGFVSVWTKTGREYRIDGSLEDFAELVGEFGDINNIIVQIAQYTVVSRTSIEAIEFHGESEDK